MTEKIKVRQNQSKCRGFGVEVLHPAGSEFFFCLFLSKHRDEKLLSNSLLFFNHTCQQKSVMYTLNSLFVRVTKMEDLQMVGVNSIAIMLLKAQVR